MWKAGSAFHVAQLSEVWGYSLSFARPTAHLITYWLLKIHCITRIISCISVSIPYVEFNSHLNYLVSTDALITIISSNVRTVLCFCWGLSLLGYSLLIDRQVCVVSLGANVSAGGKQW